MGQKLFRSTLLVGSMTLISRIVGMAREVVFATGFGATSSMDAFLVAFKIPNFLRRLFAEGAFTQAFVPVLSEYQAKESPEKLKELVARVSGTLGLIVFLVSLFGMLTSGLWIAVFAPGFWHYPEKFTLASEMLRYTFPYLFFITLTALAGGVMNVSGKFAVPAFTPTLLNIVIIACCLWLAKYFTHPEMAAAIGVFISGVVQLAFQLPFLLRLKLLSWPKWGWQYPGVKKVVKLMVPCIFGASVSQIALLLDTIFASFLKTGSVSWLYYSDRLMQFPLGVFGVALSTVVLPHLAKHFVNNREQEYRAVIAWALRLIILIALPASVMMGLLSGPILVTLFGYHAFNLFDVRMSQESLIAFSFGLFFFILVKVLVAAFYAQQNMKTPVRIAIISLLANMIFNIILIWPLAHAGLALASGLACMLNCTLLFWRLKQNGYIRLQADIGWLMLKVSIALTICALALLLWMPGTAIWYSWSMPMRMGTLSWISLAAVVAYFGLLWCFGLRKRDFL